VRLCARRHGAAGALKVGPRRGGNLGAALTPRTEEHSMRKAERIEPSTCTQCNPSAPVRRAGEEV
jgi:hypothetical protein